MKKYNVYIIYFWLVVAILSSLFAIFKYTQPEPSDPMTYYMPVLAFVLFGMRKWYSGKLKGRDEESENQ